MNEEFLIHFYRLLLRLYPRDHRDTYTEEMTGVFRQALSDAKNRGNVAVLSLILRELISLPSQLAQAYIGSWRAWRPVLVSVPGPVWVVGWAVGTVAAIPLAWLLMVPSAALLLLLLRLMGAGAAINPNVLRTLGFLLGITLSTATIQWYLLRSYLPRAGWWFAATVFGWVLAGSVLAILSVLAVRLNPNLVVWMPRIMPPLLGLLLGLPQTLILRRITPRAAWWIPINLMAFSSILLAGRAFESILELVVIMTLPGVLNAGGIWWLLQHALHDRRIAGTANLSEKRSWLRRPGVLALLIISLLAFCAVLPWAYTVAQLELAKYEGIYATPEEAIIARHGEGWGGANVVSIQNVHASPNRRDGGMDHVWFGGATVTYDRVPIGGRRDSYTTGSYYIRLRNGWVHVPEGAFPTLIGRLMKIYGIEIEAEP